MNYKKLMHTRIMKNTKAISPIFATLILIAIAVIAGIIVYMFTSGYLSGMAGSTGTIQDKLSVPAASTDSVVVTNMGETPVTVTAAILKDANGAVVDTMTTLPANAANIAVGGTVDILTGFDLTDVVVGQTYTVTLTTSGGGSFVSAPFTYAL